MKGAKFAFARLIMNRAKKMGVTGDILWNDEKGDMLRMSLFPPRYLSRPRLIVKPSYHSSTILGRPYINSWTINSHRTRKDTLSLPRVALLSFPRFQEMFASLFHCSRRSSASRGFRRQKFQVMAQLQRIEMVKGYSDVLTSKWIVNHNV